MIEEAAVRNAKYHNTTANSTVCLVALPVQKLLNNLL
jgi:hypothetical protein